MNNNRIWCTIEDANNGVFRGLNELMKFYLAGNKIKAINEDAFVGLKSLTHLNLSNNNITSIQKNAFLHLPNLTVSFCFKNNLWKTDDFILKGSIRLLFCPINLLNTRGER